MRLQVMWDAANALQFPPVRAGGNSPVSVSAGLPWKRFLRLEPLINADYQGRVRLTYAGKDDDSRLYVALMSLSYAKPLDWVRECKTCHKWFMAAREKNRFCSTLCRVKWHAHTDEGKDKRAAYMRKHRADLKTLWEAKQGGRELKRGRKLHVSLKRGE
jgi:hypothetical protein